MIKILFFMVIVEGFFILMYFMSQSFLNQVSRLVTELKLLISRAPTHSFLLLIEKYCPYSMPV
ncbi:MAG: hypothetical protein P4M11_15440 [Candidatus Pacebacteria bacterium]|nr:hypothetical protein [Candidatus Paceibacterota bacterium]